MTSERERTVPSGAGREPQLFRFGLRQLFLFVAGCSALLGLLVYTEGVWPWVIGSFTALVVAHVFSTVIGTRLRDHSPELQQWQTYRTDGGDRPAIGVGPRAISAGELPPATPLATSREVSRWRLVVVIAGMTIGMIAGGCIILQTTTGPLTWSEVAIGSAACGVLSGWFAYLAGSFGFTSRHALKHATSEDRRARAAASVMRR